ncbi:ABATE domain-containing protein [Streptomyces sp. NPDC002896]|uniref:CGNR zinc finger domain-containing protein n=1 Tax=Streptomyces sp. NPDC002896 TaxID=3154438 RepID=UPI0033169145
MIERATFDAPTAADLEFRFRSGRLCLAFAGTVGARWHDGGYERLRTPADLARWYVEAGLLDDAVPVTEAGLTRARTAREAVYRAAKALIAGRSPDPADEETLNAAAAEPPLIPRMRGRAATLAVPAAGAEGAALSTLARDAIELFTGPEAERMRECESAECSLLFVDLSRPGKRRWCSSTACGGKERAANYRERQRNRPRDQKTHEDPVEGLSTF